MPVPVVNLVRLAIGGKSDDPALMCDLCRLIFGLSLTCFGHEPRWKPKS
ncbi:MAG: hypothetical protein WCB75_18595 [Pseudolabrys sp.]|jgi:hypothetical protein